MNDQIVEKTVAEASAASTEDKGPDWLAQEWPIKWTLIKPVQAHGEIVKMLEFREPTGKDIENCGLPCYIDFSGATPRPVINPIPMSAMLSALAAVPPSTIRSLHPKDWTNCAWSLAGFFIPDLGTISL